MFCFGRRGLYLEFSSLSEEDGLCAKSVGIGSDTNFDVACFGAWSGMNGFTCSHCGDDVFRGDSFSSYMLDKRIDRGCEAVGSKLFFSNFVDNIARDKTGWDVPFKSLAKHVSLQQIL